MKRFRIGRLARCLAIVVFATTVGYRSASAQTIAGQVVDLVTGRGIGAGFVVLMDGADRETARLLTSADGEFEFRGVRPGVYRLKSERIAYRATFSPRFELRRGESQRFRLEIEALALELAAIEVRGETSCRTRPSEGEATAILWEEIRKALAAATWTASQRGYRYRHLQYQRELGRRGRRVTAEQSQERTGFYQAPFLSRDADTLAVEGYVVDRDGEMWFFAPDAKVLQAEAFLRTHCFRVVRDRDDYEGMIGLAFEPTPGRRVTDIKGTLWLDERSSELRTLEFRYTNFIHDIDDNRVGGTVEFLQMPNGAWVVYRWEIRMPRLGVERKVDINLPSMERVVVRGYRDEGGEVVHVQTAGGETVYSADVARLSGVVTDYRGERKLAGAKVSLAGTNYSTMTDEAGRFVLTGFIDGEYAVAYSHSWLDSLGFTPQPAPITLRRGESRFLELVVPEPLAILAAVCREVDMEDDERAIVGNVVSGETGSPIGNAEVTVSWQRGLQGRDQLTTSTDSTGRYELCGVPTDQTIFVRAQARTLEGAPVTVTFDRDGVWYNRHVCLDVSEADLRRGSAGIQANCFARRELRPTEDLIWRQDFTLGDPDEIKRGR